MIKQLGNEMLRNLLPPRTLREGLELLVLFIIIICRQNFQWLASGVCSLFLDRAVGVLISSEFPHWSCMVRPNISSAVLKILETEKFPKTKGWVPLLSPRYALCPGERAPLASSFISQIGCTLPGAQPLLHSPSAKLFKQAVRHLALLILHSLSPTTPGCLIYSQVQLLWDPALQQWPPLPGCQHSD